MDVQDPSFHEQFLTLFTANEPAIRAYVRRLVPTTYDAADVMQGVALVLWRKFRELDQPDDFRKWSFGVARYEALAWLRDKARDRLVLAEDVLHTVANESSQDEERLSAQRDALVDLRTSQAVLIDNNGTPASNSQGYDPSIRQYAKDCVWREGYTRESILKLPEAKCPLIRDNLVIEVPADQTQFTQRYPA
jgi:RNA polymerase sigma factor (sigma-70 family)